MTEGAPIRIISVIYDICSSLGAARIWNVPDLSEDLTSKPDLKMGY